jgi:hypothetical protein
MSLDTTNGIEVQIAIKTPFTDAISLTVSHRGALRKFESHIKAVYDGKKQYDISKMQIQMIGISVTRHYV